MELSEDIKIATDIIQHLTKAKKTLRMYPANNPVYLKTLEDLYERFKNFFHFKDALMLKMGQHSISYDAEQIYHNPEKEDNLALFFFKDGLRELTFKKGLSKEELEEFLKIIILDFEREMHDDDIVTLLWEKGFQHIQYVIDESFVFDTAASDYEIQALKAAKEKPTDFDKLRQAPVEELIQEVEEAPVTSNVEIIIDDVQMLMRELEKDSLDKIGKVTTILFELLYHSEEMPELREDTVKYLKEAIKFCMKTGDIPTLLYSMEKMTKMIEDPLSSTEMRRDIITLLTYLSGDEVINLLGELLDSSTEVEEDDFTRLVKLLDKSAIPRLARILGEVQTKRGRDKVTDALVSLGATDIRALGKALNDQRWHVVRSIVYVLRRIGDKAAVEHLLKAVIHPDARIRKEVARTLGELGRHEVLPALRRCLEDTDGEVRTTAARAVAAIGSKTAKRIILEKMADKEFKEKDFEEKKEFYEVLSRWKDRDVFEFLMEMLNKKAFFERANVTENRACAAYCLGLLGNKDALPYLRKYRDDKHKLLRDFSNTAIKRLERG